MAIKKAIYDTVDSFRRTELLERMIFGHHREIISVRKYKLERDDSYIGHVEDATFAVNNQPQGSYPLELWARTEEDIRKAANRIGILTGLRLEIVSMELEK